MVRPEVARPPVPAQVQVEDVEACASEVVGQAAGGQVPRVPVLPEPVHEEHRSQRAAAALRSAFAHHGERDASVGDDDFLLERAHQVPVDDLFDESAVEDHV